MRSPYTPPQSIVCDNDVDARERSARRRPRSLTLISISAFIAGVIVLLIAVAGLLATEHGRSEELIIGFSILFFSVLCLVAGLGMFRVRRWGPILWSVLTLIPAGGVHLVTGRTANHQLWVYIFLAFFITALWSVWVVFRVERVAAPA